MQMILSRWIIFPLVLLLGLVLTASYVLGHREYSYLMIPIIVLIAAAYVLHPEIDRWYVKKYPLKLPKGMLRFISDHLPTYRLMNKDQQQAFESATSTYLKTASFMPQGFDRVPEDLKVVVAANAHILSAFRPEWNTQLAEFSNIVVYRHPFPSPQFPEHLHSSELYVQDRVILLCADHFMKAFRSPGEFFNTAMYEWAKVIFLKTKPEFKLDIATLPEISGFENEVIVEYIGLPESYIQWEAVATTYFFSFPVRYKMYLPESYDKLCEFYAVDPMELINAQS